MKKRPRRASRPRRPPFYGLTPGESAYGTSRIVILPVPYGGTVTYGKGSEKGPEAIRAASQQVELFDEETRREPYRLGIHSLPPVACRGATPAQVVARVRRAVAPLLADGRFVVTLGGEHSVSSGTTSLHAARYPGLTIVHFDAHSDLREEYHGAAHNHACAAARMREHARLIQIGIRSQCPEERAIIDRGEVETLFAYQMQGRDWAPEVLAKIEEGSPVYVSFDLDYFDPSIMPATGTPEPGGGEWWPTLRFLRGLCEKACLVGFDVVELAPIRGLHAPDFLAARLVYKMLAYALPETGAAPPC